jgi:hypothetical protein
MNAPHQLCALLMRFLYSNFVAGFYLLIDTGARLIAIRAVLARMPQAMARRF